LLGQVFNQGVVDKFQIQPQLQIFPPRWLKIENLKLKIEN